MHNEQLIADEIGVSLKQVSTTISLLDDGATIPFIARYRKELTGSLDEVQIAAIRDRTTQLQELEKRRIAVLKSIKSQEKLTDELASKIAGCLTLSELEDLYLPYRPRRKTRANMAKERGLEPLAMFILSGRGENLNDKAVQFIDTEKGIDDVEKALAGARDILAELVTEDVAVRSYSRDFFYHQGKMISRVVPDKEEKAVKYKDYYDWSEPIKLAPSHRILAMRRGEKEEFLYLDIEVDGKSVVSYIERKYIDCSNDCAAQLKMAIADGYKRLLKPAMETEMRLLTRQKADEEAIRVFVENVRQLLLAAPLGEKRLMGIDPGFRTGCKVVVLNAQGILQKHTTIFPHLGANKEVESAKIIRELVDTYKVEAIAIGNGTAGRETESFVRNLALLDVAIVMVNESGASIYSASEIAREEFPNYDITVRGAISIGRRLMDPLAELVKIDPKSIGVGQYQHDVDQNKLQIALDDTVMSCVNAVGVELNTASKQILAYVSGLGASLAQNIVKYREDNGPFKSRTELKKVPRLGNKAFEQAAGFLRIRDAVNPLDKSAVHPERYQVVENMASDLNCTVEDLITKEEYRKRIKPQAYCTDEIGLPTLKDIIEELAKPGRDPRMEFEAFSFTDGINSIHDLTTGMKLTGIVTNITNFGAFVDIGVKQDGLIHISQLSDAFISDPNQVVKVQQQVVVTVMEVDEKRNRISLSMKEDKPLGESKKVRKKKSTTNDFANKLTALQQKFT